MSGGSSSSSSGSPSSRSRNPAPLAGRNGGDLEVNNNNNDGSNNNNADAGGGGGGGGGWPWRFLGSVPPREVDLDVMDGLARDADVNLPHFLPPDEAPGGRRFLNPVDDAEDEMELLHLQDLLPGMVPAPQDFAARIGLNETPITRVSR